MNEDLFLKIIDDLSQYKLGKFCLYMQNEPFLDKRWFDWAEKAVNRLSMQRFEVSTNLSPLKEKTIEKLADFLGGISHEVWISFHGTDKENYERIMGLKFDRALDNLESFARIAQERDLVFRIHGMGEPKLETHRKGFLFDKVAYNKFLQKFAADRGLAPLPVRFYKYHDRAGGVSNREHNFDYFRPDLTGCYCHRADTWLHVRYTGDTLLCCHDYTRDATLGDLNAQSIAEFFQSDFFKHFQDQALGKTDSPEDFICKRCAFPGG